MSNSMNSSMDIGPRVQIDAASFPPIMDAIIQTPACWTAIRGTCRSYRARADSQAFAHIRIDVEVTSDYSVHITVRAPHGFLPVIPRPAPWGWERSPKTPAELRLLRSSMQYLQHARVVDMPGFGIVAADLCHLIGCFHLLDVLRFYDCGRLAADDQGVAGWQHVNNWPEVTVHPATVVVLFPYVPDKEGIMDFPEPWHYPTIKARVAKVVVNVMYSHGTGPFAPPIPYHDENDEDVEDAPLATKETVFIFHPIDKVVSCGCGEDLAQTAWHECSGFVNTVVERIARWAQVAGFVAKVIKKDIMANPNEVEHVVRLIDFPPDPQLDDLNDTMATKKGFLGLITESTRETWEEVGKESKPANVVFQTREEYVQGMSPRQIELEMEVGSAGSFAASSGDVAHSRPDAHEQ